MRCSSFTRAGCAAAVVALALVAVASCSGSDGSAVPNPSGDGPRSQPDTGVENPPSQDGAPNTSDAATGDGGKCSPRPSAGATCPAGECYCTGPSGCFASSIATECCTQPVSCRTTDGGNPDAASCQGSHPIVDAGVRYCSPDHCYCASRDTCLAEQIATTCCPDPAVICY